MEAKGITFDIVSKEDAMHFLEEHNYYVKVASYRFNYPKHKGKYVGLDFFHLKELSIIDMYFRQIVLQACLAIEHAIKVNLLHDITCKDLDDYKIVEVYNEKYPKCLEGILRHRKTAYTRHLLAKYTHPNYPIWAMLESVSFGDLVTFYRFYEEQYGYSLIDYRILYNVRDIRNAAAHNNCIINELGDKSYIPRHLLREELQPMGFSNLMINNKLSNQSIHDFVALLYTLQTIIASDEVKERCFQDFVDFFGGRMIRSKTYFEKNSLLVSTYHFSKTILDNYRKNI